MISDRRLTRRELLKGAALMGAAAVAGTGKRAEAAAELAPLPPLEYSLEERLDPFLAGREPIAKRVSLDIPAIAEDGSVVPVEISVDSPMTDSDRVRALWLFVDKNPDPLIFSAKLQPRLGAARWKMKIRMRESSKVRAIAEMNDGRLYMGEAEVEVHISGCG